MMDESQVVPKGSHFLRSDGHDGVRDNLTWRHRCNVAPVQYFYIDFGLSGWYPQGQKNATAVGISGQMKDLPEFSSSAPYNLFKRDICQLGRTILQEIKVSNSIHHHVFHPLTLNRNTQIFMSLCHSRKGWRGPFQMIDPPLPKHWQSSRP